MSRQKNENNDWRNGLMNGERIENKDNEFF